MDYLPAELKLQVLHEMPNKAALDALVEASSNYHTVYHANQRAILHSVLYREMTAPVFARALALVEPAKKWQFKESSKKESEDLMTAVLRYSLQYHRDAIESNSSKKFVDIKSLLRIAKFHETVKAIGQDFFLTCLSATWSTTGEWALSETEAGRIHEAIYNIEIMFSMHKSADTVLSRLTAQVNHQSLPMSWQYMIRFFSDAFGLGGLKVEEMNCIMAYMCTKYDCILDESSQYLRKTGSDDATLRKIKESSRQYDHAAGEFYRSRYWLSVNLAGMGMGYFWTIQNQNRPKKMVQLLRNLKPLRPQTDVRLRIQVTAMEDSIFNLLDNHSAFPCDPRSDSVALEQNTPNSHWINEILIHISTWARSSVTARHTRAALAEWGYVMWDNQRLREMGVMWLNCVHRYRECGKEYLERQEAKYNPKPTRVVMVGRNPLGVNTALLNTAVGSNIIMPSLPRVVVGPNLDANFPPLNTAVARDITPPVPLWPCRPSVQSNS